MHMPKETVRFKLPLYFYQILKIGNSNFWMNRKDFDSSITFI